MDQQPPPPGRYAYTKNLHFQRWLNTIQAKESRQVPDEIIEYVKQTLENRKIDKKKLTVYQIRDILRNLPHGGKWYDSASTIISVISNGRGALPVLTPEQEKDCMRYFDQIKDTPRLNFENAARNIAAHVLAKPLAEEKTENPENDPSVTSDAREAPDISQS